MYSIVVQITENTLNKLLNNKTVTVKDQNGHNVTLVFPEANKSLFTRMKRNVKNGKGTRVNLDKLDDILVQDVIDGGNIMRSLKKGFKKVDKAFKKAGKYIAKNAGDAAESVKKVVPKKDLSIALQTLATAGIIAGTTAIGQPALGVPLAMGATKGIDAGVNTIYANDFSKKQTAKGWQKAAIKGTTETAIKTAVNSAKSVGAPSKATTVTVPEAIPVATVVDGSGAKKKRVTKPKSKPKSKGGNVSIKLDGRVHRGAYRKTNEVVVGGSFMQIGV